MKTGPVVPARIVCDPDGLPQSADYGDIYHPLSGAAEQARHVFLAGNGLPARWAGRERFTILETGFGLGNNLLATWDAWQRNAQRCRRLDFVSIERHPPSRADLRRWHRDSPWPPLAAALEHAWPVATHNLHRMAFENGQVTLMLCLGDVADWLRELAVSADAIYLDGFAPARNPAMWSERVFAALARRAAPGATAATWSAARIVRDGLQQAGFVVETAAGFGGKRDITLARHAPRFVAEAPPGRRAAAAGSDRHALVLGAGLAGCSVVAALAEQGWRTTLIDRHMLPAQEASGNPAGLFHGVVHAEDGPHARFNRAAALQASRCIGPAVTGDGVPGALCGLLRLEPDDDARALQTVIERLGLPPGYVRAVDAAESGRLAGITLNHPGWFFPDAGWVDPAALARNWIARAGTACSWLGGREVHGLRRCAGGWEVLDAGGSPFASAPVVVLANAAGTARLLPGLDLPLERLRGQLSLAGAAACERHGLPRPAVPIAGAGYLVPLPGGRLAFGATSQAEDDDGRVRAADHRQNLGQLARLLGRQIGLQPGELDGRTAWRCATPDRLPMIGAVPAFAAAAASRQDQPRLVPREAGLFLFTALGSRGIAWSALGAKVLAAIIAGVAVPLEGGLLDAIDPARFAARRARWPARSADAAGATKAATRQP